MATRDDLQGAFIQQRKQVDTLYNHDDGDDAEHNEYRPLRADDYQQDNGHKPPARSRSC